ncbi:hypothetical protein BDW66DRAFT_140719, partial [Aspergillus desertorum]
MTKEQYQIDMVMVLLSFMKFSGELCFMGMVLIITVYGSGKPHWRKKTKLCFAYL